MFIMRAISTAVRFSLMVLAGICVVVAIVRARQCCSSITELPAVAMLGAGLALGVGLFWIASFARRAVVGRLIIEMALLGAVLITAEALVVAAKPHTWTRNAAVQKEILRQRAAERMGVSFDTRSISAVVDSLRTEGVNALPGIGRGWITKEPVKNYMADGFVSLSHASNATVVECNESGKYLVYRTDEFGFNNPPGLVAGGQVSIAVVGSSFALGHCVPPGSAAVDLIRAIYPRTANFSMAETRSLSQLAAFREYIEPLQPAIVLWFVDPGFATEDIERDNEALARYLNPSFSQRLVYHQSRTDDVITRLALPLQAEVDGAIEKEMQRAAAERFSRLYTLSQVRRSLNLLGRRQGAYATPDLALFEQCLRLAQQAVAGWGGQMVVVVLPNYGELVGEEPESVRRRSVVSAVNEIGLPLIDGAELFLTSSDPLGLFALRIANHPSERGHELLADRILDDLSRIHPQ
jgi:hypothetical protein